MLVLIDNYDSFTYNLVQYLGDLGAECTIYRNDKITAAAVIAQNPRGIIISPGPSDPEHAGICLDLIGKAAANDIPLFGVCLGHQAIGQAFGGKVIRAPEPPEYWPIYLANERAFAGEGQTLERSDADFDAGWQAEEQTSGGFYDPTTGALDVGRYRAARAQVLDHLRTEHGVDAVVFPAIALRGGAGSGSSRAAVQPPPRPIPALRRCKAVIRAVTQVNRYGHFQNLHRPQPAGRSSRRDRNSGRRRPGEV